jgi:glycosyltransferase involved in cell wall biosynthesis
MKIGIGITTKNRPEVAEYCISQYKKFSKEAHRIVLLDDDSEPGKTLSSIPSGVEYIKDGVWRGVAGSRNRLLRELADCDFVVISDDDVFPIRDFWIGEFVAGVMNNPGQHILNYSPPMHYEWMGKTGNGIVATKSSQGGFWFFTRHALNVIGGFRELSKYGHEDGELFARMGRAGLSPFGRDPYYTVTVEHAPEFLHGCDIQGSHGSLVWKGKSAIHEEKWKYIEEAEKAMRGVQSLPIYQDIYKNNR